MLRFVGNGDQNKFTKNSPPIFNAKFPGKFEEQIHKSFFVESGKSISRSQNSKLPQIGSGACVELQIAKTCPNIDNYQSAPKERRRRRAGKRSSI